MKINQKGFGVVEVLLGVVLIGGLLFVPNPVSSAIGVGVRPNKTVQKESSYEKVELLKDEKGNPVLAADGAYLVKRTGGSTLDDRDQQQKVSLWEQIRSLPTLLFLLTLAGAFFPPLGAALVAVWMRGRKIVRRILGEKEKLLTDTKKIVLGVDRAFATVPLTLAGVNLPGEIDRAALAEKIIDEMKWELRDFYNDSTKALVKSIKEPA